MSNTLSTTTPARDQRARRKAARQGLRVVKFRDNERWANEYGPYSLADTHANALIAWGMDLETLESELREREELSAENTPREARLPRGACWSP